DFHVTGVQTCALPIYLLSEQVRYRYDFIVMNPPFHQGREAEPDMGRRIIKAAAVALKPGGRLLMVANRQLPYERTLAEVFSSHRSEERRVGEECVATR